MAWNEVNTRADLRNTVVELQQELAALQRQLAHQAALLRQAWELSQAVINTYPVVWIDEDEKHSYDLTQTRLKAQTLLLLLREAVGEGK